VTKTHLRFVGSQSAFGFEAVFIPATVCFEAYAVGAGYLYEISRESFVAALELQQSLHVFRAQFTALIAERALVNGGCRALHSTAARLARLILEAQDTFGADTPLTLTQKEIGEMLSVRRESVATVFGEWSSRGIIETSRGRLSVPSRDAMLSLSCACYEATKQITSTSDQQWRDFPWSRRSAISAQQAA